jgi:hypothetical protein
MESFGSDAPVRSSTSRREQLSSCRAGSNTGWVNLGPRTSRLLFTFVPGGLDDFFAEIGRTSPNNWPELAQRHDTWIVGPPIDVKGNNPNSSASSV